MADICDRTKLGGFAQIDLVVIETLDGTGDLFAGSELGLLSASTLNAASTDKVRTNQPGPDVAVLQAVSHTVALALGRGLD